MDDMLDQMDSEVRETFLNQLRALREAVTLPPGGNVTWDAGYQRMLTTLERAMALVKTAEADGWFAEPDSSPRLVYERTCTTETQQLLLHIYKEPADSTFTWELLDTSGDWPHTVVEGSTSTLIDAIAAVWAGVWQKDIDALTPPLPNEGA